MNDKLKKEQAADDVNLPAVTDQQAAVMLPETNILFDNGKFSQIERIAEIMASGNCTVPAHLHNNKGDCFAVAMQAAMWGMNPFAVAQKTHLVNKVLGYEAQLVNAVVSSNNAIRGHFHYEYNWEDGAINGMIRCGAVLKGETEITWGEWLDTRTVTTKNSPLWKTAPKQQAAYLVVKYWSRIYTPGAILGVYTPDELEERPMRDITPAQEVKGGASVEDLKAKLGLKTAAEISKPVEVVEEKPLLSEIVQAEIAKSGAPITLEDVTAYLATKKIKTALNDMHKDPKLAQWFNHISIDTALFIKNAAEWVTSRT